jgi:hypothetical protein
MAYFFIFIGSLNLVSAIWKKQKAGGRIVDLVLAAFCFCFAFLS